MRITAAGGVSSPSHLWALQELQPLGLDSVIVGRALYENKFPCQKIWRQAEARLEVPIED
jgi:phosphoribosylformimino-5-aminoimidazole carboxamide ribotide isomerase